MRGTKLFGWILFIFTFCAMYTEPVLLQQKPAEFPEFVFETWGSAPSRRVYLLEKERAVQKIFYCIRECYLTAEEIAENISEEESLVLEKLKELEQYGLVKRERDKWILNFPLYVKEEISEAEKLGLKYAKKEAEILRKAIPKLKELHSKTKLSKSFSWDEVSLIIVGAFLADFCVIDRIPFRPENFTEEMLPPIELSTGFRWGYTGFEKLPQRYPSLKWKFYQNLSKKYIGGTSVFGYYIPNEERKRAPSYPEYWISAWAEHKEGKILFALAENALTLEELKAETGLKKEILVQTLAKMTSADPPAVTLKGEKYYSGIPILTESDLSLLLPELDKIAEEIFKQVVLPHLKERKERAHALGSRWPLPGELLARDKAIQILVDEGLLSRISSPPVSWNFNFWGWKGFLRLWNEIKEDIQPDLFLKTSVSQEEKSAIEEFNLLKEKILKGEKFLDNSTPVKSLLTRISGWINRDISALRAVEVPWDHINDNIFEEASYKRLVQHLKHLEIRRIRLPEKESKDGDLVPIFTIDSYGNEATHIFFYYRGSWRVLDITLRDWLWRYGAEKTLKEKLLYLEGKQTLR